MLMAISFAKLPDTLSFCSLSSKNTAKYTLLPASSEKPTNQALPSDLHLSRRLSANWNYTAHRQPGSFRVALL